MTHACYKTPFLFLLHNDSILIHNVIVSFVYIELDSLSKLFYKGTVSLACAPAQATVSPAE